MLRKYSNSRTLSDNIQLGSLTAFSAGMTNIATLLIFLSFSSNITGYYAILAAEITKGEFYKAAIVLIWIGAFFMGSFISNFIVIHLNKKNMYFAHSLPIVLEMICLFSVGFYGELFYDETLVETEILLTFMLFAMGLQNGLTASISNFSVKTTHLTGATTDLALLMSMFTKKEFRENKELVNRAKLLIVIFISYFSGSIFSGLLYQRIHFKTFYLICFILFIVLIYDYFKIKFIAKQIQKNRN